MVKYLPTLLVVGLTIYCLIDCVQTRPEAVRNLSKPVWLLLILLLPPFGGIGWLLAGRAEGEARRGGRGPVRGPQGPDDDPDFLRGLGKGPRR